MADTPHAKTADGLRRPAGTLPSRRTLKRLALGAVVVLATAAAAQFGLEYWRVGRFMVSTDDATIQADSTIVAPKVSGYIAEVLVRDNQHVAAGQILARIDDRDLRTALDTARAGVADAEAAIRNLDAQIDLQRSVIAQSQAQLAITEANLQFAREDRSRYGALARIGASSLQESQQAQATLAGTSARLARDQAAAAAEAKRIDVLTTQRAEAVAQRDRALAAQHQAELNLSYATITAPVAGTVGARALRVGQYVQAGTQLMAVVPLHAVYVVADYKETQLTDVHAGQPAEVTVDEFPGVTLKGHVDSLSPASGLEFALLPPDNATGNFTKIVQRIPVKIVLDGGALAGRLRPGMSVEPTIDTRAVEPTIDTRPADAAD